MQKEMQMKIKMPLGELEQIVILLKQQKRTQQHLILVESLKSCCSI